MEKSFKDARYGNTDAFYDGYKDIICHDAFIERTRCRVVNAMFYVSPTVLTH